MQRISPEAKLLNLPQEQQAQLAAWLLGGMPYHVARERVAQEFGVQVLNDRPFTEFWQKVCVAELVKKRKRALTTARQIVRKASRRATHLNTAAEEVLQQKVFELAIAPNVELKSLKEVVSMAMDVGKLEVSRGRLALAREKHEFDGAKQCKEHAGEIKEIAANPNLSEREKINAIRERLFGKLPEVGVGGE